MREKNLSSEDAPEGFKSKDYYPKISKLLVMSHDLTI